MRSTARSRRISRRAFHPRRMATCASRQCARRALTRRRRRLVTTIGDTLSAKGVSWAWYAGGWNAAVKDGMQPPGARRTAIYNGDKGAILFQPHHQPFNYYARFAPGTADRERHLKDYADLLAGIDRGELPSVAFYKPQGTFNEHPGYTDVLSGDAHIAALIARIKASPLWTSSASSSPTTRMAASGTMPHRRPATAGARARAFRRSSCRRSRRRLTWITRSTIRRRSSNSSRCALVSSRCPACGECRGSHAGTRLWALKPW